MNSPTAWSARAAYACPLEAVGWTASGQSDRFNAVVEHLDIQPADRILDFGCGLGAFADRLPADARYLGFDTSIGMVERARREHPERTFTDEWPSGRFDHVVAIGCFNLAGFWSKHHTFHVLRYLFDSTSCKTLIASLYAGDDERCLRYTEAELERAGRDLGYGAVVERHRPNDLLLAVSR